MHFFCCCLLNYQTQKFYFPFKFIDDGSYKISAKQNLYKLLNFNYFMLHATLEYVIISKKQFIVSLLMMVLIFLFY